MADPINYSGGIYDSSSYRKPQESMYEYMQRLAAQRARGILGGGAMFDTTPSVDPVTNEITDTALGSVVQNCPEGYYFDVRTQSCVRRSSGSSFERQVPQTQQEKVQGAVDLLSGRSPKASTALGLLPIPFIGAIGKILDPIQREQAIELAKADLMSTGMTEAEADRVLEGADEYGAERLAEVHGLGLSGTMPRYDYIPDTGIISNAGSRIWSGIARGEMGPISAAALDTTTPNPYNSLVASIMGQDPSTIRASGGMAFGPYQNTDSYSRNPITGRVEYTPAQTAQGMFGTYTPNYNFNVSNYTADQGVIGAHNLVSDAAFNQAILQDYGNQSQGTSGGVTVTTMDGTTYGGNYTDSSGDTYNDGFGSDFNSDWESATSGDW